MVLIVRIVLIRSTNMAGTKRHVSFVARQVMVLIVRIVPKKNIGMELVLTNADGVVMLPLVLIVRIAQQRFMRNKFMDMNLW